MKEHSRSSVSLMFGRRPISDGRLPQPPVHHRTHVKYIIIYIIAKAFTLSQNTCQSDALYCKLWHRCNWLRKLQTNLSKRCCILQTLIWFSWNASSLEVSENRFFFVCAPWSLLVKGCRIFQWLMVVPPIGCHEWSSHTERRFTFAKSSENKAAAEGKGDIGGFYVMTFPIPICISMHWNGLNKTNTTTQAKANHHRASRKVLSIITRWGHEWGMNSSQRSLRRV